MHCVSRGGCYLVNSTCDLQEDNHWKKESYQACWLSLVLETRPQYKLTLSETNSIQRESYKQQQVVHFTVQRSLSQTLKLGSNSRTTTQRQLPIINTSKDLHPVTPAFGHSQQKPVIPEKRNNAVLKHERSAVSQYVTKPIRVNFRASSLMASPGETSQRAQRRQ